jgi:hypothetical protein
MNPGLTLKADAALAVHLVARHRAPQLAAVILTGAVIVTARWTTPETSGGISPVATLLAAAAVQGGVVGSRLATPAALATARAAGAVASVMVIGRLGGAAAVLFPFLFAQSAAVVPLARVGTVLLISMVLALSVAALTMAAARWSGSTAAALLVPALVLGSAVPTLAPAVHGHIHSVLFSLLVSGVGFIAVTAGAVVSLRERPLRLKKPTPTPTPTPSRRARRWGRDARP